MGRKITYTPEIAEEICRRLAGGESLRAICRDEHMPDESSVREWALEDRNGFAPQYLRARELQAHHMADEIIDIADNASNDWMAREDPDNPGFTLNGEHIQRSRMRFDARRWYLSKVLPKVYGDKLDMTHGNPDGTPLTFGWKSS